MRYLIILLMVVAWCSCSAQTSSGICVQVDCKDTVKYPQDTVTLNGAVTSTDGIKSVKWSVTSGVASIDSPAKVSTVARKLSAGGMYVFSLTAVSNKGATGTAFDSVFYIPNKPPVAVVGATVNTATNTAVLSGSGSYDPDSLGITYAWAQTAGPNTAVINTATMVNPLLSGLINGTYGFKLTVTDKGGLTSSATQSVVVNIVVIKTITTTTKYYSDGTSTTTTVTTTP